MVIFEMGMLICFGISWPFSIIKVLQTRSSEGKSFAFLWLLLLGYVFGISFKITGECDFVIWFYLLNATLVVTDMSLCYYFAKRNKR
ncbi:MAG: hypothetical protein LBQ54_02405 [Planctomycetaceae bacterium]|nr:hypothetical protein [Planctomycetaceae bacterium]